MRCPQCDAEISADARFCAACGTPRPSDVPDGSDGSPDDDVTEVVRETETTDPDLTPVEVDAAELQVCPRCGGTNSASRMLCGRCGADLRGAGSQAAVRPAETRVTDPVPSDHPEPTSESRRRTGLLVVVLAVLFGLVVGGGLLAAGIVGGDSGGVAPTFDPALYPEPPARLSIREVATTTTGPEAGPGRIADGDISTAWHNDGERNPRGTGERITLRPEVSAWVTAVVIAPGDQAPADPFGAYARPVEMRLILDGERTFRLELLDRPGQQQITLPEPVLTTTVQFEVLAGVRGDSNPALAISEITVLGHPAPGISPDAAAGDAD